MKRRIICQNVVYCFEHEVQSIYKNEITLKPGYSLRRVETDSPPEYSCTREYDLPGHAKQETLTISMLDGADSPLITMQQLHVIVLIQTDSEPILMGSSLYPCKVDVEHTGMVYTVTITSTNLNEVL